MPENRILPEKHDSQGMRRMHWRVGKVKITKVVELETVGSTRFILPLAEKEEIRKLPWLIPHFATEEGRLKMSIHSLVVEAGKRRIGSIPGSATTSRAAACRPGTIATVRS